jgi:putative transposase
MDVADSFAFPQGSVVVFDRGCSNYIWHKQLTEGGMFWVTRARKGMVHEAVKTLPVPEGGPVLWEQIIRLTSYTALQAELPEIRRVEYREPETGKVYVFLTNHRRLAAQTVADTYKSRWGIELFFKFIKQNLKIRSVLGHSMNAVASQLFVALCVYLLVAFQKFVSRSAMGSQAVLRLAQLSLFQRKPLADLLRGRKHGPPNPQMPLRQRAA